MFIPVNCRNVNTHTYVNTYLWMLLCGIVIYEFKTLNTHTHATLHTYIHSKYTEIYHTLTDTHTYISYIHT